MRGLFEITLRKGMPAMAAKMLTFCKSVDHRQWAFEHPLKQFSGDRHTHDILAKLEKKKTTLDRLRDMKHDEIGAFACLPACLLAWGSFLHAQY